MKRLLNVCLVAVLAAPSALKAQALPPDTELVAGIRQVKEGDFEGALLTLDGVSRKLTGDPSRVRDLAQAHLYLGIACLALEQNEPAKTHFRQAAEGDKDLRLSAERFSPKVIAAFDEARREAVARPAGGGGSKTGLVVLGVGGTAAAVALVAKGGGSTGESGVARFVNARFGTPVIECSNGLKNVPISFTILVDGSNGTASPVTISSVSATVIVVASAIPSEIGLASSLASTATPATLSPGSSATLTIASALLCDNDPGNAPRFNEWSGRVTLTTSAGVFTLEAADTLRVNVP